MAPGSDRVSDINTAYRIGLKSLARRYLELHDEIANVPGCNDRRHRQRAGADTVARNSIGHIGAAQLLLTAGDNPERLRSEASCASLCGVTHLPASSSGTGSTEVEIAQQTARCISSPSEEPTDRPENQGLCYSSDSRRAFQTRRHSSLEALPRPRGLHAHHAASPRNQRHTKSPLDKQKGVQGSQFTSLEFTGVLTAAGVALSMDGKGAWRDNVFVERLWRTVKYEEVYLRAYDSVSQARASISRYLAFYNGGRPHSSLDQRTPDEAYFGAQAMATAA